MAGTASSAPAFLLVEDPGPWGVEALRDARLPDGVGPALRRAAAKAGVKVLLARRHGRSPHEPGHRVFAVSARPHAPWTQTALIEDLHALLDLDLEALRAGRSVGLEPHSAPLLCVCTHGRHDACCAERGRPVAAALAAAHPELTWEVSHVGGDRFAGNLVIAPEGLYYGRLTPDEAVRVADAHLRGELSLDRLRGRSGYAMSVQAAEIALRKQLGDPSVTAWRIRGRTVDDDVTTVDFETRDALYRVRVRATPAQAVALTCRAGREQPPIEHTALDIVRSAD